MMMYEADKLNRVRKLAKRQEYLKEQLREYKESYGIKGAVIDEMAQYRGKGITSNPIEKYWIRYFEIMDQLEKLKYDMMIEHIEIEYLINRLENSHREVLRLRYLKLLSWKDIFKEMDLEDYKIVKLHREAVAKFEILVGKQI